MVFIVILRLIVALMILESVIGRVLFPGKIVTKSSDILSSYDYVIVGGGTSGLVVANRLSEDLQTTVLIIEAGGFDEQEDFITIPILSTANVPILGSGAKGTKYDWNMTGVPQAELQNRSIPTPAGKVIGGGTVLNGMVYNRGSKEDYNRWEELGNPGWNFDALLPYFKRAETFTPPSAEVAEWDIEYVPEYHGEHGRVQSSFPRFVWPSSRAYINSMRELNVPILKDSMGGDDAGAFWFLLSLDPKNETRSTSQSFYTPSRPNLHLLANNQVSRVVFQSGSLNVAAIGVEFSTGKGDKMNQVSAVKEVILAAGALHTPQILQLSGIGDTNHLSYLGIETVVDLPGVGANYQDHPLLVTVQSVDISINTGNFSNATWNAEMRSLYDEKREGPYTTAAGNFFAFLPLSLFTNSTSTFISQASAQSPAQYLPPNTSSSIISGYAAQHAILTRDLSSQSLANQEFIFGDTVIIPSLQTPFSRGTVLINSTSPFDFPVINPRYLSNPLDVAVLVAGFKYARTIRATSALQEIGVQETYPGMTVQTDEQIEDFIRDGLNTENHHGCTAAMLPRHLGGVVDSELRVYGVQGLRVIDASIMPMLPAAHLQATVYGIAEKGADLVKMSSQKDN